MLDKTWQKLNPDPEIFLKIRILKPAQRKSKHAGKVQAQFKYLHFGTIHKPRGTFFLLKFQTPCLVCMECVYEWPQ